MFTIDSYLLVYDIESGNLLERHNVSEEMKKDYPDVPRISLTSIHALNGVLLVNGVSPIEGYDEIEDLAEGDDNYKKELEEYYNNYVDLYLIKYDVLNNVKIEVQGNGTIDTQMQAKEGEEVKVDSKPDEGSILDSLIVTDENGNNIEVKDNTFTMPKGDVTIKAVFKEKEKEEVVVPDTPSEDNSGRENPNTGTFINYSLVIGLSLVSLIILIVYKKNKKIYKL